MNEPASPDGPATPKQRRTITRLAGRLYLRQTTGRHPDAVLDRFTERTAAQMIASLRHELARADELDPHRLPRQR